MESFGYSITISHPFPFGTVTVSPGFQVFSGWKFSIAGACRDTLAGSRPSLAQSICRVTSTSWSSQVASETSVLVPVYGRWWRGFFSAGLDRVILHPVTDHFTAFHSNSSQNFQRGRLSTPYPGLRPVMPYSIPRHLFPPSHNISPISP